MAEARAGMGVDCDLCHLAGRKLVSALHFQRRGPCLDLEASGERQRDQCSCDLLMHLDDALAKEILDQMEDRAAVALQEPADRGKLPVDVNLGPAHRQFAALGMTEAADGQPLLAFGDASTC